MGSGAAGGAAGLQRKFIPPAAPDSPDQEHTTAGATHARSPLVLVASLVDKTPNLAGLCRTSEVFHIESLCVANGKVVKEQAFQSISVTAEKWLPIREVPKTGMRQHLIEMRRRGYSLVGI